MARQFHVEYMQLVLCSFRLLAQGSPQHKLSAHPCLTPARSCQHLGLQSTFPSKSFGNVAQTGSYHWAIKIRLRVVRTLEFEGASYKRSTQQAVWSRQHGVDETGANNASLFRFGGRCCLHAIRAADSARGWETRDAHVMSRLMRRVACCRAELGQSSGAACGLTKGVRRGRKSP